MLRILKISSVILVVIIFSISISYFIHDEESNSNDFYYEKKEILIGNKKIIVDIADDDLKREKGLSGRERLNDLEGMLFIFDKEGRYGFWMKDMNFSIDIIWINSEYEVVDISPNEIVYIEKDLNPESYPNVYYPDSDSSLVLEVVSGFSEENNLKVGDILGI